MNRMNKRGVVEFLGLGAVAMLMSLPVSAQQPSAIAGPNAATTMEETTVKSAGADSVVSTRIHGSAREQRAMKVSYADLNLDSSAGIETLYFRLEAAARVVCAPREQSREIARQRDWQQCYNSAVDGAVAAVGNPQLRDKHFARTGRQEPATDSIARR